MTDLEAAEAIAIKLREQPYHLFYYNCFNKSSRFVKECRKQGIKARAVGCIGLARARFFGHWFTIPALHGWGEVASRRIETSRPLGHSGVWGIVPMNIKPVIAIWYK